MRKALLIRADGESALTEMPDDSAAALAFLQAAVGGHIELAKMTSDWVVYCNEEGKLNGLPINLVATKLAECYPHDVIVGNVIVVGPPDEEGEDTGLSADALLKLIEIFG